MSGQTGLIVLYTFVFIVVPRSFQALERARVDRFREYQQVRDTIPKLVHRVKCRKTSFPRRVYVPQGGVVDCFR